MQKHLELFAKNSSLLYKACIHKLPAIRNLALDRATSMGMDISFVIRLLESDLPSTQQAVFTYLDKLEAGSTKEWEATLAMCDSPNTYTRKLGMDFFQSVNPSGQPRNSCNCSNFCRNMPTLLCITGWQRELVAQQVESSFVQRFDKEVLRMKNHSRKAKESIKYRQQQSPTLATNILLEMAKSKHKKDAEWAIWQLTQRTLSGEEIQGFDLK